MTFTHFYFFLFAIILNFLSFRMEKKFNIIMHANIDEKNKEDLFRFLGLKLIVFLKSVNREKYVECQFCI